MNYRLAPTLISKSETVNMMDGKLVNDEFKCDTRCNDDGVDRISQLPEDVILHILSYLLLDRAARTSILSTRWRELNSILSSVVKPVVCLISGESSLDGNRGKFIERVNSTVEKHKAHSSNISKFTLVCGLDRSSDFEIIKWLEFAFSKRIQELELIFDLQAMEDIYIWYESKAVFLDSLLMYIPTNLLESSNLKSLCLGKLVVDGLTIKLILRYFHLLERLIISNVHSTSEEIDVCGRATAPAPAPALVLKHLEISYCTGIKSIKVSAPNLIHLKICNDQESKLLVKNAPKLVEVDIYSSKQSNVEEFCFVSQLQILNTHTFQSQDILAKEISSTPKLMELRVNYHGRSTNIMSKLASFIIASPLLQTFELEAQHMKFANVETFNHHHVREFKFSGFNIDAADHREFVSFVLDNCVALRKLIIRICKTYRKLSPRPDLKARIAKREGDVEKAKQLLQPKLRSQIQLHFIITYT